MKALITYLTRHEMELEIDTFDYDTAMIEAKNQYTSRARLSSQMLPYPHQIQLFDEGEVENVAA